MKQNEAKIFIVKILTEKGTVTAQEINYASKGTLPFVQIYGILSLLINNGSVQLNKSDGKKTYTLIDAEKINDEVPKNIKMKPEKEKVTKEIEEDVPKEKPKKKTGRDLTKYKFNNQEFNKSRLVHAIISAYCKEKKPSFKMLEETFPISLVAPYGTWDKIKSAVEKSKEYKRFFITEQEQIKTKEGIIAISNQWSSDRLEKVLTIAKKLGYKIK